MTTHNLDTNRIDIPNDIPWQMDNEIGEPNQSNPMQPRNESEAESQTEIGDTNGVNHAEVNDSTQTHARVLDTIDAEIEALQKLLASKQQSRGRAEIGLEIVDSLNNWLLDNPESDVTTRLHESDSSFGVSMFWSVDENSFVYGQLLPAPNSPKPGTIATNNSVPSIPIVSVGQKKSRTWISRIEKNGSVYNAETPGFMKTDRSNNVPMIEQLTGVSMFDANNNNLSTIAKKQRLETAGFVVEIGSTE